MTITAAAIRRPERIPMMKLIRVMATLAITMIAVPPIQAGTVYDAAADFSATNNPDGVWSYGWTQNLGTAFTLDLQTLIIGSFNSWQGPISSGGYGYPSVLHNPTSSTVTFDTIRMQPGQLAESPAPHGQYAVVRFTAPSAGSYTLSTSFVGIDFVGPTTTDVHVLVDGSAIFNGAVDGFGPGSGPSFTTTLNLGKGATVDFAVGYGSDGTYDYDWTGVSATLSTVPEPSSMVLVSLAGALGGAAYRWRRRLAAAC